MSANGTPNRVTRASASKYKIELLGGIPNIPKSSTDVDFKSFEQKVKRQKKQLERKYSHWTSEVKQHEIPAKYNSEIFELLSEIEIFLSKNFQQLINFTKIYKTEKNGERTVKMNDLEGHWSLLLIQLDKFNTKFNYFEEMNKKNWKNFKR